MNCIGRWLYRYRFSDEQAQNPSRMMFSRNIQTLLSTPLTQLRPELIYHLKENGHQYTFDLREISRCRENPYTRRRLHPLVRAQIRRLMSSTPIEPSPERELTETEYETQILTTINQRVNLSGRNLDLQNI